LLLNQDCIDDQDQSMCQADLDTWSIADPQHNITPTYTMRHNGVSVLKPVLIVNATERNIAMSELASESNNGAEAQLNAIVIGATGLVGHELLSRLLLSGHYQTIYAVVRKPEAESPTTSANAPTRIEWIVTPDFTQLATRLASYDLTGADAFSALGSTQKQAGSKAAFYQIDHDYNLAFAEAVFQQGARHLLLVSAQGANPDSFIFYNKVKGELEADVSKIDFDFVSIFRPSLLLGERSNDKRLGEGLAQTIFNLSNPMIPAPFSARPIEASRVALAMAQMAYLKSLRYREAITQVQTQVGTASLGPETTPHHHKVSIYSNQAMLKATLNAF